MAGEAEGAGSFPKGCVRCRDRRVLPPHRVTVTASAADSVCLVVGGVDNGSPGGGGKQAEQYGDEELAHIIPDRFLLQKNARNEPGPRGDGNARHRAGSRGRPGQPIVIFEDISAEIDLLSRGLFWLLFGTAFL